MKERDDTSRRESERELPAHAREGTRKEGRGRWREGRERQRERQRERTEGNFQFSLDKVVHKFGLRSCPGPGGGSGGSGGSEVGVVIPDPRQYGGQGGYRGQQGQRDDELLFCCCFLVSQPPYPGRMVRESRCEIRIRPPPCTRTHALS